MIFDNEPPPLDSRFAYWSAKETAFVNRVQAVILSAVDMRSAVQVDYEEDETLWKIYWWGGHRDHALIQRLRLEPSFKQVADPDGTRMRVGFQEASRKDPAGWLKQFMEFPTNAFERYGPLPEGKLIKPPTRVHRRREKFIYQGARLLIKRGIDQNEVDGGSIAARFETKPFSFRHSIYCVPIAAANGKKRTMADDRAKIVLGILWSTVTRYYLFLTSGTWGLWHDDLRKEVLYTIPTRLPNDPALAKEIVMIVDELRDLPDEVADSDLFVGRGISKAERDALITNLEQQLNDAIYRLFELTDSERERVEEFCDLELDLFYKGMASTAVLPFDWPDQTIRCGRRSDLKKPVLKNNELAHYLATFLDLWEPQLEDQNGWLRWRIIRLSVASSMTAVIFETESKDDPLPDPSKDIEEEWHAVLARLDKAALMPAKSKRVYIDGLVRIVCDSDIAIIKRNERRLWTKSAARDDAEAAMVLAMQLGEQATRGQS